MLGGLTKPSSNFLNACLIIIGFAVITSVADCNMKDQIKANRAVSQQILEELKANHEVVNKNARRLDYLVDIMPSNPRVTTRPWDGY